MVGLRMLSSNRRGMTFVELLLAATMIAVLMVGFAAHLRGGVLAWRRAVAITEQVQRTRVALDQLGRDLSNAFDFDPTAPATPSTLEPKLVMERERLTFFSVRSTDSEGAPTAEPLVITYELSEGKLLRLARGLREAVAIAKGNALDTAQPAVLLDGVKEFSIQFAYKPQDPTQDLEWKPSWGYPNELPRLCEFSITLERGPKATEVIRHTFVLPSGVLKLVPPGGGP